MNEVLYSLNGKYFKDFGIGILKSEGLFDKLNPKKSQGYDWAEYHGKTYPQGKVYYEEREITLNGWIVGESWEHLKTSYDTFLSEFDSGDTARLIIEFKRKELVYDVYLESSDLKKTFRQGQIFGTFTLKLKEPNPVKKVLKLVGEKLTLSFNSDKWIEISIDGKIESVRGKTDINKNIPSRLLTRYYFAGRNLAKDSEQPKWNPNNTGTGTSIEMTEPDGKFVRITPNSGKPVSVFGYLISDFENGKFSRSMWFRHFHTGSVRIWGQEVPSGRWVWLKDEGYSNINGWNGFDSDTANVAIDVKKFKCEKGTKATDWTPAPEEVHYITLAGDVDEIKELKTNAEVLWEKI